MNMMMIMMMMMMMMNDDDDDEDDTNSKNKQKKNQKEDFKRSIEAPRYNPCAVEIADFTIETTQNSYRRQKKILNRS